MKRWLGERAEAHRSDSHDSGVTAVLVALWLLVIMGFAALAVDISLHTHTRQELWDTLDASALSGGGLLPDGQAAYQAAYDYAKANMPDLEPDIDFFCVVGVDGSGNVEESHIPFMCDPGPGPYVAGNYPGLECNDRMCFIPCNPLTPEFDECNTMRVRGSTDVSYSFAPVLGMDEGSTGTLASAACKGPCGAIIKNPADIVLTVDRTGSMGSADLAALKAASNAFLEGLDTTLHDVALATIGRTRSNASSSCPTQPSTNKNSGPWVAVGFTNDYDLTDNNPPDNPPNLNSSNAIVKGISCLSSSSTGTNLGDPIAAAGAYANANGRADAGKGVVFMTDGEANGPNSNGNCNYAVNQASQVKGTGVIVVTIAYRLQGVDCEGVPATTVLATMASDSAFGPATEDDGGDGVGGLPGGCETQASINGENNDGDLFFCAPEPGQLSAVFAQASDAILAELSERTILVKPPG